MNDFHRDKYLKQLGYIIIRIKECVWKKTNKESLPKSSISSLIYKNQVSQNTMLAEILRDNVYGFALVDIEQTSKTDKFIDLNWLPVIKHDVIEHHDLPDFMKSRVTKNSFPRKTLVQALHATEHLLHTKLIQWYVNNGFIITKIHTMFEYQKYSCYKDVHDKIYEARVDATIQKNNQKATAIKLVSNSMYGQMIMVRFVFKVRKIEYLMLNN